MPDPARAPLAGDRELRRELGLRDVALFAIACICGMRWIAPAARGGWSSLLVWVLAAAFFSIPLAIVIAALGSRHARPGGFYWWTRADFGPWHGFLCFWTYWMGIALWFPSAAMFYVSMLASVSGAGLHDSAQSRAGIVAGALAVLWIALGANMVGVRIGKWTENIAALACWLLALLLGAAALLAYVRNGSATPVHGVSKPSWDTIGFWANIAYAMSGMELVALMGGEIREPKRTLPRAAAIASAFALIFYLTATAAVLILVQPERLSELTGLAEAAGRAGTVLNAGWLRPVVAVLIVVSAVGQFGGIGAATSRLPFALGVDHLLPGAFSRIHPRWYTPHISMLALGCVCSAILIAIQFGDTARAAYDTMVSLMIIAGFAPYVYIFASAWRAGIRVSAASGLTVTAIAIVCSMIPSAGIADIWLFEGKLAGGTALIILSAWLVYRRRARHSV